MIDEPASPGNWLAVRGFLAAAGAEERVEVWKLIELPETGQESAGGAVADGGGREREEFFFELSVAQRVFGRAAGVADVLLVVAAAHEDNAHNRLVLGEVLVLDEAHLCPQGRNRRVPH